MNGTRVNDIFLVQSIDINIVGCSNIIGVYDNISIAEKVAEFNRSALTTKQRLVIIKINQPLDRGHKDVLIPRLR